MVYQPSTQDELADAAVDRAKDKSEKLTNFIERTVNGVLIREVYAGYQQLFENALLAVQLSGWVRYAGGPITEQDLIELDIPNPESVDLELVNYYTNDSDLEELAALNGIQRDPGAYSTGEVLFYVSDDSIVINSGTQVTTGRDEQGNVLSYRTTEQVTPEEDGTTVTARIRAEQRGKEHNVPSGTINTLPTVPGGVDEVINPKPTSGGEPPETNEERRNRTIGSVFLMSGGGTRRGVIGSVVSAFDGVDRDNVSLIERFDPDPEQDEYGYDDPYFKFIVDGAETDEVTDVIDDARPVGMWREVEPPTYHTIDIDLEVTGSGINVGNVREQIAGHLAELGLGEDVIRYQIYDAISDVDDNVENVPSLTIESSIDGVVGGDLQLSPDEVARAGTITVTVGF
jgi:uncharacterized phage protein gp47/JayE